MTIDKRKLWDVIERVLWTLAEGASAVGIVTFLSAVGVHLDAAVWVPILGALLAVVKTSLAQQFGNGTGATLPSSVEPIPQPDTTAVADVTLPEVPATPEGADTTAEA